MARGGKVDPTSVKLMFSFMQTFFSAVMAAMLVALVIQDIIDFRRNCTQHPIPASAGPRPADPETAVPCLTLEEALQPVMRYPEPPICRRFTEDEPQEVAFEKTNELSN